MTAATYQCNRTVSSAETVPIRRYILSRVRNFFPLQRRQEDTRHLKKTRPASGTLRPPIDKRNRRRQHRGADDGGAKVRYWFPVILLLLRHLTAFRYYQEPISMSRLFIPRTGSRRAPTRYICLPKRTSSGCCLDIAETRRYRAAWKKLSHLVGWKYFIHQRRIFCISFKSSSCKDRLFNLFNLGCSQINLEDLEN